MKVFGLTGKTGAGKTTVSDILREMGFYVVNGDIVARNVTEKGKAALKELANAFGSDIISEDGTLNRKLLASRAFANKKSTALLNSITHPHIKKEFEAEIEKAKNEGFSGVIIDAAALLESDCKNLCKKIIVVAAPEEIRLQRILLRDSITEEQAKTRINAQFSDEYYEREADIIIRNYPPYDKNIKAELSLFLESVDEH